MSECIRAEPRKPAAPTAMMMPTALLQRKCACGQHTGSGGECESCRQKREGTPQRAAVSSGSAVAPPIVHEVLRSSGRPLDSATRAFMEPRFGHDFSQVRVHADARAAESARAVNALAYTVGRDVVFGAGQHAPETMAGRRLLAHELTHVVQQGKSPQLSRVVHRAVDDRVDAAQDAAEAQTSATARLLAIVDEMEKVHSYANTQIATQHNEQEAAEGGLADAQGPDPASQNILGELQNHIEQLRAAANGGDEALKQSILTAFTPQMFAQAESQLQLTPSAATGPASDAGVTVRQQTAERIAAKSIGVSDPQDAAELEASRVASMVIDHGTFTIQQTGLTNQLNRQVGEALVAAGSGLLVFEAEAAPVEIGTGPPGWVVGGVILLSAAALLAAGYVLTRTRTCPPCPASPPPEIDRVPPSTPHFPCPGDHWHYQVYNQNPQTCQCFLSGRMFGGCCGMPPITTDPRAPAPPC